MRTCLLLLTVFLCCGFTTKRGIDKRADRRITAAYETIAFQEAVIRAMEGEIEDLRQELDQEHARRDLEAQIEETEEWKAKAGTVHAWGGTIGTIVMTIVAGKLGLDKRKLKNGNGNG